MSRATLKPIVSKLREAIIKGVAGKLEKYGFDENGKLVVEKPLSEYDETIRDNLVALFEAKEINTQEKYVDYIHNTSRTFMHILICFKLMEKRGIMGSLLERVIGTDIYNEIIPDFVSVNPMAFDEFVTKNESEIQKLSMKDNNEEEEEYYQFIYLMNVMTHKMAQEVPLLFKEYEFNLIQPSFDDLKIILQKISAIELDEYQADDFLGWIYQYWVDTDEAEKNKAKEERNISFGNKALFLVLDQLAAEQTEYGEFYTPREVVQKIVDKSIEEYRGSHQKQIEEIKLIDIACGAGNFLVYAFDKFKKLYDIEHADWSEEKKINSILRCNIYGVDVQREPLQITALNLWIKAKSIATSIDVGMLNLYNVNILMANSLYRWETEEEYHQISLFDTEESLQEKKFTSEDIGRLLSSRQENTHNTAIKFFKNKYEIVVMNPPYLGIRKMKKDNADFLKKNYPNNYINLFEAFVVRAIELLVKDGICGFVSSNTFLTLSSHENIRNMLLMNTQITYLENLGHIFDGPTVDACIMILHNTKAKKDNKIECKYGEKIEHHRQRDFLEIKGAPIIEGISRTVIQLFKNNKGFGEYVLVKQGMISGDNKKYLRYKWEVPMEMIGKRFFPYANGGGYSKYANDILEYIDWQCDGKILKAEAKKKYGSESRTIKNVEYFFKGGITYSEISGNTFSARYYPDGCIFSNKGPCIFSDEIDRLYLLGFTNSLYFNYVAKLLNPTVGFAVGDIERIPFIKPDAMTEKLVIDCAQTILEDKRFVIGFDYKSDFYKCSEIEYGYSKGAKDIYEAYDFYRNECEKRINRICEKSEVINHSIFKLYGFGEEEMLAIENNLEATICSVNDITEFEKACFYFIKAIAKNSMINEKAQIYTAEELNKKIISYIEEKYNRELIEDLEKILKKDICSIIVNGVNLGGTNIKFSGKTSKELHEPILLSRILAGVGKNSISVYWNNIQYLIEFEENKRYAMQNEIRRLTNEVYLPKLQRAKEKLQAEGLSASEKKNLEKEVSLYEECVKTLENWKVVD